MPLRKLLRSGLAVYVSVSLAGCAWFGQNARNPFASQPSAAEYTQIITVLKPIEGMPITITYQGNAVYRVLVKNTRPGVVNLMWDQSAYVTTQGESIRLLHLPGWGRTLHEPPAQQAESPIAPGAELDADFTGETWLEFSRSGNPPQPKDSSKKARLFLSFKIKGKRVAWHGEIAFSRPGKP